MATPPAPRLRVGVDLVAVSAVAHSLETFGARFVERVFTPGEGRSVRLGAGFDAQRLATRLAAKEAVIKALDLTEAGVGWRQIEVCGGGSGPPRLVLHGRAARCAAEAGVSELALSLSHEGDMACAVVVALRRDASIDLDINPG